MSAVEEANEMPSGDDLQVFLDAWHTMSILTSGMGPGASHEDRMACARVKNWLEGVISRSRRLDEILSGAT